MVHVLGDDVAADEHREVPVGDDVGELLTAVPGVHRDRHGAEECRAEQHLDVVEAVGHHDAHVVTGSDAEGEQPAGAVHRPLV